MEDPISARERAEIAVLVGIDDQYLYQCLTGRKHMRPKEAVRVERESGRRLRRWHLRRVDWHETWPELVGADGAPPVPSGGIGLEVDCAEESGHVATVSSKAVVANPNAGEGFA